MVVTKGGDGGVYREPPEPRHWRDNGRVVLTGDGIRGEALIGFVAGLAETIDPADRAHLIRQKYIKDHSPMTPHNSRLADPAVIETRYGSHPPGRLRRYHRSQMTSRGMPYDSMFDGAAQTAAALQIALGIDLGWRTSYPKPPKAEVVGANEYDRERMFRGLRSDQIRDLIRPRVGQRMTAAERKLEREASDMLRAAAHVPQGTKKKNDVNHDSVPESGTNPGTYRGTPCRASTTV